jgi:hypothetical protein
MATAIQVQAIESARSNYTPLVLFSCGHFCVDLYSIALGVMQPLLAAAACPAAGRRLDLAPLCATRRPLTILFFPVVMPLGGFFLALKLRE